MTKGKKHVNMIESKMKVVILHGKHNSGKTTTFNHLYEELLSRKAEVCESKRELPGRDDFECVLKYNDKKIALFSLGDYMFAIGSAVGYYTRANCDVLVVAHSLKTPIHQNSLFKARKYPYVIINKELDGAEISTKEAVEKILDELR